LRVRQGAKKQGGKCPRRSRERWVMIHFYNKPPPI
jgi:hypothetical protein